MQRVLVLEIQIIKRASRPLLLRSLKPRYHFELHRDLGVLSYNLLIASTTEYSTMSVVSVLNVTVNDNPAPFGAPYEFEITFECLEALQKGKATLQTSS